MYSSLLLLCTSSDVKSLNTLGIHVAHVLKKDSNKQTDDNIQDSALNEGNGNIENESSDEVNDSLEIITDDPKTSTPHNSNKGGRRRLAPVNYRNDRPAVTILPVSGQRKGGSVRHSSKKTETESHQVHPEDEFEGQETTQDTNDSLQQRKKRLQHNPSNPSAQLIILVIGGVLSCVLLTGFIRWRVRRRLNAKKLKKMADNYLIYRGKTGIPKQCAMDTIYECACEDVQDTTRLHETPQIGDSICSEDEGKSKFEEDVCSHKFDMPPSWRSHRHNNETQSRSAHTGESYHQGGAKQHIPGKHKHRGHRKGHSSHHKRKNSEKLYPQRLQTTSAKQTDNTDGEETTHGQETTFPSQPQLLLIQNSPQTHRGIMGSVVDMWRSLSFNRDWVGRMWQEQHNVRRISDVLRGLTSKTNSDTEDSQHESTFSVEDMEGQSSVIHLPTVIETSVVENEAKNKQCEVDPCSFKAESESCTEVKLFIENGAETCSERNCFTGNLVVDEADSLTNRISRDDSALQDVVVSANIRCVETESHPTPSFDSFRRFVLINEHEEKPPEYESLLDTVSHYNSLSHRNEHTRHHRRHRRRRTEGRERSTGHVYNRVQDADVMEHFNDIESEGSTLSVPNHRLDEVSATASTASHTIDTASSETPSCQSDLNQEQNRDHNLFGSSPSGVCIPTMAVPFVQQEGIVIEQLSDGGKIIYLPPPALPSYHNDTPPPYQQ